MLANKGISMKKLSDKGFSFLVILIAIIILVVVAIYFIHKDKITVLIKSDNIAENELKSVYSPFINRGSWTKVCKKGDTGKGVDNDKPWIVYVFKTSSSDDLKQEIISNASEKGYSLVIDNERVDAVSGLTGYKNSIYLKDRASKNNHTVRIAGAGDIVSPDCTINGKYMPNLDVQPGQKLVEINFSLSAR